MRILYSLLILVLFTIQAYSLEAPYLYQATTLNSNSIQLTWRNNDVNTSNILILRKSEQSDFEAIKSVSVSTSNYVDNILEANTEYTYCLIAKNNSNEYSDTSNILSATTFDTEISFYVPLLSYNLTSTSLSITFIDSCTIEKGFRLHSKTNNENWLIIDSIISQKPSNIDTLNFELNPNSKSFITYKIEAYNDSGSVFSPESTVYFFGEKEDFQYHFTKLGSIPANPISWVERVGDSLFFPEIVSGNDTQIVIIDISNNSRPSFSAYLDINNLPEQIKNSHIGIKVGNSPIKNFIADVNGFYYTFSNNHIYKYDSLSLIDSLDFSFLNQDKGDSLTTCIYHGSINDSLHLFSISRYNDYNGTTPLNIYSFIINSTDNNIDTLANIFFWQSGSSGGAGGVRSFGGNITVNNDNLIFLNGTSQSGYRTYRYSHFSLLEGFKDILTCYTYKVTDKPTNYIYGSKVCGFEQKYIICNVANNLYICDPRDPLQNINNSYGYYYDTLAIGNIHTLIPDTTNSKLFLFSEGALTLISYEKEEVGINKNLTKSVNSFKKDIKINMLSNNVQIKFNQPFDGSICIYNALGKKVFNSSISNRKSFIWNKKTNSNKYVPSGFYCIRIKSKDFQISKSLVITN